MTRNIPTTLAHRGEATPGAWRAGSRALLAFASLSIVSAGGLEAQTVTGRVLDRINLQGISGASVRLFDAEGSVAASATTDGQGEFTLRAPAGGRYSLEVVRLGYRVVHSQSFEIPDGQTVPVELRVSPEALLLAPLDVNAGDERGGDTFERRRSEWGKGIFVTPEQIEALGPHHPADILDAQEGVRVDWSFGLTDADSRTPVPIPSVRTSLGNGCVAYLIDGRPSRPPPWTTVTPWALFPLSGLRAQDIAATEIYRSVAEAPPELRAAGARAIASTRAPEAPTEDFTASTPTPPNEEQCGVVVYWTREKW